MNQGVDTTEATKTKTLKFSYKDVNYTSTFIVDTEVGIVYQDPTVAKLMKQLSSNPNLATIKELDGSYTFLDDASEMKTSNPELKNNGVEFETHAILWQHEGYAGSRLTVNSRVSYINLKQQGFGDTASSVTAYNKNTNGRNMQLSMYQHDTYGGKVLQIVVKPGEMRGYVNLKHIHLDSGIDVGSPIQPNWTDQISSVKYLLY